MLNFKAKVLVVAYMLFFSFSAESQIDTLSQRKLNVKKINQNQPVFNQYRFYFQALGSANMVLNNKLTWLNIKPTGSINTARILYEYADKNLPVSFYFQAGFSANDLYGHYDRPNTQINPILDAYGEYIFAKTLKIGFGQKLLPGNRNGYTQEFGLQFATRSLFSQNFSLDRDFGLFVGSSFSINDFEIHPEIAVTSGEGRNFAHLNNGGLNYTLHVKLKPFGAFTGTNQNFMGDVEREQTPKVVFGFTYNYNDNATRQNGQFGDFLPVERDIKTFYADVLFKYKGVSFYAEWVDRFVPIPVVYDTSFNKIAVFYSGKAFNAQGGYFVGKNVEVVGRYTQIAPTPVTLQNKVNSFTIGVNNYFNSNLIRLQADVGFTKIDVNTNYNMLARLQLQVGF